MLPEPAFLVVGARATSDLLLWICSALECQVDPYHPSRAKARGGGEWRPSSAPRASCELGARALV